MDCPYCEGAVEGRLTVHLSTCPSVPRDKRPVNTKNDMLAALGSAFRAPEDYDDHTGQYDAPIDVYLPGDEPC